MQADHLSKVQRTGDGVQERNGQVLIPSQLREMGHSGDRPASRKRGDGRLARSAGTLYHPEGAKGRNFRQRRKPEEGPPVRGLLPKRNNASVFDRRDETEMECYSPKRKPKR